MNELWLVVCGFDPGGIFEISRWRQPPDLVRLGSGVPAGPLDEEPVMPSTHIALHVHVVFSTKDRMPHIASEWRTRLHAFLGGVLRNLDVVPEAVGGVADHVHLLVGLRATHALANVVRDVKAVSSRWIHEEIGIMKFSWQEGYGAFSVSPSQCQAVRQYIDGQDEHHRKKGFQEEYLEFLTKCGVPYDERFLW